MLYVIVFICRVSFDIMVLLFSVLTSIKDNKIESLPFNDHENAGNFFLFLLFNLRSTILSSNLSYAFVLYAIQSNHIAASGESYSV